MSDDFKKMVQETLKATDHHIATLRIQMAAAKGQRAALQALLDKGETEGPKVVAMPVKQEAPLRCIGCGQEHDNPSPLCKRGEAKSGIQDTVSDGNSIKNDEKNDVHKSGVRIPDGEVVLPNGPTAGMHLVDAEKLPIISPAQAKVFLALVELRRGPQATRWISMTELARAAQVGQVDYALGVLSRLSYVKNFGEYGSPAWWPLAKGVPRSGNSIFKTRRPPEPNEEDGPAPADLAREHKENGGPLGVFKDDHSKTVEYLEKKGHRVEHMRGKTWMLDGSIVAALTVLEVVNRHRRAADLPEVHLLP